MSKKKIGEPENEDNIYAEYFKYTREYQSKYGDKTIVLMQVGSFLEVYGVRDAISGELIESRIKDYVELLQCNIADKKNGYGNKGQIVMAGFNVYLLDKNVPRLLEGGFTVVVYLQEAKKDNEKSHKRVLYKIYSPGTYLSCESDSSTQITNNIMCIWLHLSKPLLTSRTSKTRDNMVCGASIINVFTGKSYIFEYQTPFLLNNTTFDDLERLVSVFKPSELLFLSPLDQGDIQKIIQYTGINTSSIHYYDTNDTTNTKVANCSSQQYIKQILTAFYNEETYDICSEFNENCMATQSFCFLLNFIQEHNPDLVRKISLPIFNNVSDRLVLANHTLMQLNIIDSGSGDNMGKCSSVMSFLNCCCSPIGKRKFQYQLTNPTSNEHWLNKEYEMISEMLEPNKFEMIENFRKILTQIRDIEKICRQIVIKKIYPSSIAYLYKSIELVQQINTCLYECPTIVEYLCGDFIEDSIQSYQPYVENLCSNFLSYINTKFNINSCKKINSMNSFDENIIQAGVSEKLDTTIQDYEKSQRIFVGLKQQLNQIIFKNGDSAAVDLEYVKIHETEKSGASLQMTSKRSQNLKIIIDKMENPVLDLEGTMVNLKDIKFSKLNSTSTNVELESPVINQICKKIFVFKDIINKLISEIYVKVLEDVENLWLTKLENIVSYISKIDILQCKAYLAKKNNYCCPILNSSSEKSYVDAYDLRHCLIEKIQQNETYVPNDISLGKPDQSGVLLYGTNAVGKTSLIRALGVSVIMAQAGMFVPCSRFVYKPYTAIFSRILGNDNIFKGLSTFAVEMSELRIILKMADENSLILGDELCSGTESESALSIFVAGLMKLCEKKSSFVFATHFHEIANYSEIQERSNIVLKHMAVTYDRENDCLTYDRRLKEGSGPRIYGLEVCKSLYLEDEFLELAYSIRNKYYPETRGELSNNMSTYNAKVVRGLCGICKKNPGEEIHHLSPQKDADDAGYIGTFHKNHPANLISICQECHDNLHKDNVKLKKKKTTKGMQLIAT
jgi:DNA mismatch repair protein MutS